MRMFSLRSMAACWTIGRSADLLRFFSQLFHPPKTRELTLPARCDANGTAGSHRPHLTTTLLRYYQFKYRCGFFTSQPCNVTCDGGGQRTCRPLDRGQNSTRCTSLRRALGIVGDSCQEHGESMQGGTGGKSVLFDHILRTEPAPRVVAKNRADPHLVT